MPEYELKDRYSEEEIPSLVRKLNMTYDEAFEWVNRRARKLHVDLFGKVVRPGEYYWRMRMGGSFSNDLKLSNASMERFLFVLFAPYPKWERRTEKQVSERMEDLRKIINKIAR